jgi:hypothetical protein
MDMRGRVGYAPCWTTEGMSGETTVTEAEWLNCTDPAPMLEFIRGRASERKFRLFAVACCRRIWDFLPTDACRDAVEVAERYADGQATDAERCSARSAIVESAEAEGINVFDGYESESIEWGSVPGGKAFMASIELLGGTKFEVTRVAGEAASEVAWDGSRLDECQEAVQHHFEEDFSVERIAQTLILRDIVGPLSFRSLTLDPSWLIWHGCLLVSMAQKMYESRNFNDMPVLADALEEAGCQDQDILSHCRSGGEHVRGCCVIDLVLAKS